MCMPTTCATYVPSPSLHAPQLTLVSAATSKPGSLSPPTTQHPTYSTYRTGCGSHIANVMDKVPQADRCVCTEHNPRSLLGNVFNGIKRMWA